MFKSYSSHSSSSGILRVRPSSRKPSSIPHRPSTIRYAIPSTLRKRSTARGAYNNFPEEDEWVSDKGTNTGRSVKLPSSIGSNVSIRQIYVFVVVLVTFLSFFGLCSIYYKPKVALKTHVDFDMSWQTLLEWLVASFLVTLSVGAAYWTLTSNRLFKFEDRSL
ncbi:hypothetical protein FRC03_005585 [Tulasnella sp. 419]|nr:hypothetical protein FRC02_000234 [Tulasnella sp. 418]KAG8961276.1 hypothetical protein FRC03_005585 [Tulasnella sp. 419]